MKTKILTLILLGVLTATAQIHIPSRPNLADSFKQDKNIKPDLILSSRPEIRVNEATNSTYFFTVTPGEWNTLTNLYALDFPARMASHTTDTNELPARMILELDARNRIFPVTEAEFAAVAAWPQMTVRTNRIFFYAP